jgi:hypothetical protein
MGDDDEKYIQYTTTKTSRLIVAHKGNELKTCRK